MRKYFLKNHVLRIDFSQQISVRLSWFCARWKATGVLYRFHPLKSAVCPRGTRHIWRTLEYPFVFKFLDSGLALYFGYTCGYYFPRNPDILVSRKVPTLRSSNFRSWLMKTLFRKISLLTTKYGCPQWSSAYCDGRRLYGATFMSVNILYIGSLKWLALNPCI